MEPPLAIRRIFPAHLNPIIESILLHDKQEKTKSPTHDAW